MQDARYELETNAASHPAAKESFWWRRDMYGKIMLFSYV